MPPKLATPKLRKRLYREVLTSALHRRFTEAATVAAAICYVDAVLIGEWTSCECATISETSMLTKASLQTSGRGSHLDGREFGAFFSSFQPLPFLCLELGLFISAGEPQPPLCRRSARTSSNSRLFKPSSGTFSPPGGSVKYVYGQRHLMQTLAG